MWKQRATALSRNTTIQMRVPATMGSLGRLLHMLPPLMVFTWVWALVEFFLLLVTRYVLQITFLGLRSGRNKPPLRNPLLSALEVGSSLRTGGFAKSILDSNCEGGPTSVQILQLVAKVTSVFSLSTETGITSRDNHNGNVRNGQPHYYAAWSQKVKLSKHTRDGWK